ncbi:MAG: dephospho-CoA kinase [Clostridia bacterium]|nr:dephospho-CoA kinase [Clostridia bacterium]
MQIIGVVGQSGSGKGELCRRLCDYGYLHLDTDRIYHTLLAESAPLRGDLVAAFGADILRDGQIDRGILRQKVFGEKNRKNLAKLNKITHRYVCAEVVARIMAAKRTDCVGVLIDAPLLFHARLDRLCDAVVYVDAPKEVRMARIMARDGISAAAAEARIRAGEPLSPRRLARCAYFIENDEECDLDRAAGDLAAALRQGGAS